MSHTHPTANKVRKYAAEMRTNIELMRKSRVVSAIDLHQSHNEVLHNLEQTFLNYPNAMSKHIPPNTPLAERKNLLEIEFKPREFDEDVYKFEKMTQEAARLQRQANWVWRVGQAAERFDHYNWFPFFITLTLDPTKVEERLGITTEQFWKETNHYTKWKRDLADLSARLMGHKLPRHSGISESQYAQFFGVLEHGASREHHHMHVLVWLRAIPESWKKCPNAHIRTPEFRKNQRCLPLETYWPWANPKNRPALYFRHINDIWSRHGFCTPILKKTGKALNLYPAHRAGSYCAKYLGKDTKEWNHRVRATRNLGLQWIIDLMCRIHTRRLEALTWRPRSYNLSISLQTTHTVPHALVRSLAKSILFSREWVEKSLNWEQVMDQRYDGFLQMLMSVRNGAKPHRMGLRQRYDFATEHLPEPSGYCEKRLTAAHKSLAFISPVNHVRQRTSMIGNTSD